MGNWKTYLLIGASLGSLVLFLLLMIHCSGGGGGRGEKNLVGLEKIQHIVFIIKENRTFDNYFGTFPGANGATSGTISTGQVIPLGHAPDTLPRDGSARHDAK